MKIIPNLNVAYVYTTELIGTCNSYYNERLRMYSQLLNRLKVYSLKKQSGRRDPKRLRKKVSIPLLPLHRLDCPFFEFTHR